MKNLIEEGTSIKFCHVNHDYNSLAHELAQAGLLYTLRLWPSSFPDWIVQQAQRELQFFVSPRGTFSS